uniref:NADH-ubiquinone oxidoreductase chain 6 n=1 Tax=Phlyctis petraea TaxID=2054620 RepID=A0A4P8D2N9_9LECA|nr:NADH dehydrogenase subunit 6 [Phlyctis petraea]QCI56408.1 NADH dehydrogenase subunit 6 [Phlyctis petraea]
MYKMTYTLYILQETYTNGFNFLILDFFSLISIFCAISVIINKNPVISVLYLIGLFLSIASYLITIGLSFIGLSYLLVYVGAVSILFLFILMLINVRISELLSETWNSIPLMLIIGFSLNSIFLKSIPSNSDFENFNFFSFDDSKEILLVTDSDWDSILAEIYHINSIGSVLYTSYSIWLLITSVILLLAMVGAIVITMKQKKTYY